MTKQDIQILLIGPQHVGKSTVGKILSKKLEIPFYDTDDIILKLANYKYKNIRELFAKLGEQKFRTLENQAVCNLSRPCVCATGGGFANNLSAWKTVESFSPKILLKNNPKIVWNRIISTGIPSYLSNLTLEEASQNDIKIIKKKFITIFNARMNIYREKANIIINTIAKDSYQTAHTITEKIKLYL